MDPTTTPTADNTFAVGTATGIAIDRVLAGAGSRSYAYIVDWHIRILLVLIWFLAWIVAVEWANPFESLDSADREHLLWLFTPPSLLYGLYHPVVELFMRGDSPGKRLAGISVVDKEGLPPRPGTILLRNIMRLVDSLPAFYTVGLVSIIVTKNHLRLGDMVAGTMVVITGETASQALARVSVLRNSAVDPASAELIVDLLARWKALSKERRRALAGTLLARCGIEAAAKDRALRRQLRELVKVPKATKS